MRRNANPPGPVLSVSLIAALLAITASAETPTEVPPRDLPPWPLGTPEETLVLTGRWTGHARFAARHLINRGDLLLAGGPSEIEGSLTNEGALEVREARADVRGPVMNRGRLRVTDAEVHFDAPYTEHGGYWSDPSDNYFTDLVIGTSGYLVGGTGDHFFVSGDLTSASTQNTSWSTALAALIFRTGIDAQHLLSLTGADFGPYAIGYTDNFAWGRLEIDASNSLTLADGNAAPGGALYASEVVGAQLAGGTVANVTGAAGLNLYYDPDVVANAYLGGATYLLMTAGFLVPIAPPVPIPATGPHARLALTLALMGAGLVPGFRRRRTASAPRSIQFANPQSLQPARNTQKERTEWQ